MVSIFLKSPEYGRYSLHLLLEFPYSINSNIYLIHYKDQLTGNFGFSTFWQISSEILYVFFWNFDNINDLFDLISFSEGLITRVFKRLTTNSLKYIIFLITLNIKR